ncbi:MAG: tRNA (N6-threonylcarbamoyladenosine(37)-N6)-methyltransferase TrmO [Promethearchaeota archaeon]
MSSTENIKLRPIGFVKTKAVGKEVKRRKHISKLILCEDLTEALDGIDEFSHLFILFFLDKVKSEEKKLKAYPRGRTDMPLLGVFATRIANRPNPIGLALVELLNVEGNTLTVRGLDAYDGTPVLDIKPFDYWDMVEDAKVPEWWVKLEKERSIKRKVNK